jgi:hypothetical protein
VSSGRLPVGGPGPSRHLLAAVLSVTDRHSVTDRLPGLLRPVRTTRITEEARHGTRGDMDPPNIALYISAVLFGMRAPQDYFPNLSHPTMMGDMGPP